MHFMEQAREQALLGRGRTFPNPIVGAVIVRDGEVVGRGFHQGGPHAEVIAIAEAGEHAKGATLYSTLEPCKHVGRTGACTSAIIEAGISQVIYAVADPTTLAGGGADVLRAGGVQDTFEPHEEIARDNRAWLHKARTGKPLIIAKSAMTLDGRIAAADGSSKWITGEEARGDVAALRHEVDAIVTGTGTVLADDPALTVRGFDRPVQPARIVVGTRDIPSQMQIHQDHGFTQVDSPKAALALAEERGYNAVLVEAGAGLLTSFLAEDLIVEWQLYIAPLVLGEGASVVGELDISTLTQAKKFVVAETKQIGGDVRITLTRGSDVHGNR